MTDFPYIFDSPIVSHDWGKFSYSVVFAPEDVQAELPFDQFPRLRVEADVGNTPFSGAFQPVNGRYYLLLSKRFLKLAGLELGDWVTVRLRIADQDAVNVPPALQRALEEDGHAKAMWEKLTPGKRRGLAYQVASAKTAPTQTRRAAKIIEKILLGEV
ncbi:MAG: YdeI/OmpD-associated family protein [Cyanobacteria bacterium P01_C01_bin.69]